ncbi:MAG: hypothetical protein DRN20_06285 [Thermoplasmata archaeon]|nr:MAG: hypothetical protein DRN20_06285 [Thermoplasmata archaeon]
MASKINESNKIQRRKIKIKKLFFWGVFEVKRKIEGLHLGADAGGEVVGSAKIAMPKNAQPPSFAFFRLKFEKFPNISRVRYYMHFFIAEMRKYIRLCF